MLRGDCRFQRPPRKLAEAGGIGVDHRDRGMPEAEQWRVFESDQAQLGGDRDLTLVPGPRIFAAGLNSTGMNAPGHWRNVAVRGPDEMRAAVAAELEAGATFIKLVIAHAERATDWGNVHAAGATPSGTVLLDELDALARCGLDETALLAAATSAAAAVLDQAGRLGAIVAGACADLVVLPGDPLIDITVLRQPALVISRGEVMRESWRPSPERLVGATTARWGDG